MSTELCITNESMGPGVFQLWKWTPYLWKKYQSKTFFYCDVCVCVCVCVIVLCICEPFNNHLLSLVDK